MARLLLSVIAGLLLSSVSPPQTGLSQSAGIRAYATPLDIGYTYDFEQLTQGTSCRCPPGRSALSGKPSYWADE